MSRDNYNCEKCFDEDKNGAKFLKTIVIKFARQIMSLLVSEESKTCTGDRIVQSQSKDKTCLDKRNTSRYVIAMFICFFHRVSLTVTESFLVKLEQ